VGSKIPLNVDVNYAIGLYEAGESIEEIGRKLGVSGMTIDRRMRSAGYNTRRSSASYGQIHRDRRYGDVSAAIKMYVDGATLSDSHQAFAIPRRHLEKAIIAAGETLRTQAQSLGLRYAHMTVSERRSVTAYANIAKRGRKASEKSLHKRACTMERTLQLASRADLLFCMWMAQRGIKFTPQKAVGPYNIDCAIDELLVAVEINGDWHYFPGKTDTERKRREYVINAGWHIIDINIASRGVGKKWKWLRPASADKVVIMLEEFRSDKTALSKHSVIGGDGEPLS
jgi:very-short-patch-repair endonuclease